MNTDLSKLCADFLRSSYNSNPTSRIKASHARELVAAFFGYKTHAALLAERKYPLQNIEDAEILAPDIPLMQQRSTRLSGFPDNLHDSSNLAELLATFLRKERYFVGDLWLYDTLEGYINEQLLIDHDVSISDDLSGTMAETNATFEDFPYYEHVKTEDTGDVVTIVSSGVLQGTPLDDKPFCGDTIDLGVTVTLHRIAGKRGFAYLEIQAGGSVRDDWRDTSIHYDLPNVRPKDQWIHVTGGLRFGETAQQFENRQTQIHAIRNRIANDKHTAQDIHTLSHLLGTDEQD